MSGRLGRIESCGAKPASEAVRRATRSVREGQPVGVGAGLQGDRVLSQRIAHCTLRWPWIPWLTLSWVLSAARRVGSAGGSTGLLPPTTL